jgi:short-subunit dehydrogenase
MTFVESYGPWAVIAGASEGVGASFGAAVAKEGVNVVLLARRQGVLDEVAGRIGDESGVKVRAVAVDLASSGAMQTVADATRDLDVGLLTYCAGADPNYQPFLANPVEVATAMVHRNCTVPVQMCHHFAGPMVARGRGGIIVLSSGAAFVGAPNMVIYGGSKAFDVVFTEALWTELHPQGVDVLSLVLGETDTPALRRLRAERGFVDEVGAPLPGAATVDEVVRDALARLPRGPSWIVGDQMYAGLQVLGGMPRGDAVQVLMKAASATMDHDGDGGDGDAGGS